MDRSIVIVDDDKDVRDLIRTVAYMKVYTSISYASNGLEGYDVIERERPQVIVTDVNMPEGDGISMLKRVQLIHGYNPSLVVVMSGKDLDRARIQLEPSYTYVEKPDVIGPLMQLL